MSAAEALAPEQSVDEVREGLSVTEKGQPANTIGNCRTVFCHDPLLRDAIRLNLLMRALVLSEEDAETYGKYLEKLPERCV